MTIKEFSDGFDTLLSSYAHQAPQGEEASPVDIALDEYEKSLFLTKAQKEIVIGLYNGRNIQGEAFENTEELRRYLSNIVTESTLDPETNLSGSVIGMGSMSKFFSLPEDLWFITYESVYVDDAQCDDMSILDVLPVTQDEYHKIKRNPFRGTSDRRVLRLDLSDGVIEIVSKHNVTKYYVRYLRKPSPIILIDLPDGLTIDKKFTVSPCMLHEALHQRILERAVQLAMQSRARVSNS